MLFLAVFCGFLAEYQLEHYIENNREKQYIKSFAEDLEADNIYMEERLNNFTEKIKKADSLILLLSNVDKKEGINDIYYFFRAIGRHSPFGVNDRTIIQLRNAGGMRLISNKNVSDSMVRYYKDVDNIKYLDERLIERISTQVTITDKLLDGIDWGKLTDTVDNIIVRVKEPLKLRTTDEETINAAIMNVQRMSSLTLALKMAVRRLKERANVMRQFILKEYHLE
jgi:3-methyladenine DNA glycosylase AlkD